eukprot:1811811-Rhodomonas_salina.3
MMRYFCLSCNTAMQFALALRMRLTFELWTGACDAMAPRRQTVAMGDVSGNRDLWNQPEVGTVDTTVILDTTLQPSSPSMCS